MNIPIVKHTIAIVGTVTVIMLAGIVLARHWKHHPPVPPAGFHAISSDGKLAASDDGMIVAWTSSNWRQVDTATYTIPPSATTSHAIPITSGGSLPACPDGCTCSDNMDPHGRRLVSECGDDVVAIGYDATEPTSGGPLTRSNCKPPKCTWEVVKKKAEPNPLTYTHVTTCPLNDICLSESGSSFRKATQAEIDAHKPWCEPGGPTTNCKPPTIGVADISTIQLATGSVFSDRDSHGCNSYFHWDEQSSRCTIAVIFAQLPNVTCTSLTSPGDGGTPDQTMQCWYVPEVK